LSATPFTSPLTTKGDICVYSTSADRLAVGANETFLEADSALALGMKWTSFVSKLFGILTTKGDVLVSTGATVVRKAIGSNGTIPMAISADTTGLTYVAALYGCRYGHTYAHGDGAGAGDQTNDWTFAAGGCMDVTGAYWIQTVALTKQADVAWAVGNAAGLLDTGAVGNNDYYLFVIARSDTGVTDYLMSLSSTAPTMPTNYGFKRLIGWFKRVGAVNVLMQTYETEGGGIEILWSSPTLEIDLTNTLTTTLRTDAVKVPLNFSVKALLNVVIEDATETNFVYIHCPDLTDVAPSITVAPLSTIKVQVASVSNAHLMIVRTSATGLIASRGSVATMNIYKVSTMGFTWARRN